MQHPTANKRSMKLALIALILLGGLLLTALTGCSGRGKYQVDYCGSKDCYSNAKDSYRAGTEVTLYFELVATDTDYSFRLDGEPVNYTYDDKKGFVIQFTMPDHNVKLECNSHNSMLPPDTVGGMAPVGLGGMGMGNPLSESTLEDLAEETGYTLTLPEDAFQDVSVTRIAGELPLYSVEFLYSGDGNRYTFRLQSDPAAGDISGMYYSWTESEIAEDYELHINETEQGIILWQDAQTAFSLAMEEHASRDRLLEMQGLLSSS